MDKQALVDSDAIVIGTGLGGSAAAAVLAAVGLDVTILEQNTRIGGVCASYEKDGYRVDIGTHLFSRSHRGPFGAIARRVGAELPRFRAPDEVCRLRGLDADLGIPKRGAVPMARLALRALHQLRPTPREVQEAVRLFQTVLQLPPHEVEALDDVSMWDFVNGFTQSPRIITSFGMVLGLYFILPLREMSAGEGIWCFQRMLRDRALSYPQGGSIAVPQAFVDAARRHGARLELNAKVAAIQPGPPHRVVLADGRTAAAPIVVATTSLRDVVDQLVGPHYFPADYVERVRGLRKSLVAVQAKFAVRRRVLDCGVLVGAHSRELSSFSDLTPDAFDRFFADVAAGRIPQFTPIYAPVPSNFDPSLAPPGEQLITACALAPTVDSPWSDAPRAWVDNLVQAMFELVPGLEANLRWVDTMDVRFLQQWMGKQGGPAVSCAQTPGQVGRNRPPVRTPIAGLYVAGCGAGGRGVGTELAATSGDEAAAAAIADLRNGFLGAPPSGAQQPKAPSPRTTRRSLAHASQRPS